MFIPISFSENFHENASDYWNQFYEKNEHRFFKDRHWLRIEFPELYDIPAKTESFHVMEIGCGAGNTVFPLLATNDDPRLFVHACDFSETAVSLVKVVSSTCRVIGHAGGMRLAEPRSI